jgi:hypothetical protein
MATDWKLRQSVGDPEIKIQKYVSGIGSWTPILDTKIAQFSAWFNVG